jgi:hypothetical protein
MNQKTEFSLKIKINFKEISIKRFESKKEVRI